MIELLIALPVSFAVGFASGWSLAYRKLRPAPVQLIEQEPDAVLDDWIAWDIMETAREYAEDVGRPEVADLVARKLLLAHRLKQKRGRS